MNLFRFFEKRLLVDIKAKYLLLNIELLDVRQSWAASIGDDFDWIGDHSANQRGPGASTKQQKNFSYNVKLKLTHQWLYL